MSSLLGINQARLTCFFIIHGPEVVRNSTPKNQKGGGKMAKKKNLLLNQADFVQIHTFLEQFVGQKITLPDINKDGENGVYYFSSCDRNTIDYKEQFHLHINLQGRSKFEQPYLNIKYLRIPQSKRRQKAGTKIVQYLIELAREKGFGGVELVAKNRQAFLFWQSLGFKAIYGALLEYRFQQKPETSIKKQEANNSVATGWFNLSSLLNSLKIYYQKLKAG